MTDRSDNSWPAPNPSRFPPERDMVSTFVLLAVVASLAGAVLLGDRVIAAYVTLGWAAIATIAAVIAAVRRARRG